MHGVVGGAGLAGEIGRTGTGQHHRFVFRLGDIHHGERDRRIHQVGDHVHAIDIEPAVCHRSADVRLVLVIAGDDLDRRVVDLAAELLGGHLRRLDRAVTGVLFVNARQIGQHPDPNPLVRNLRIRSAAQQQTCNDGCRQPREIDLAFHGRSLPRSVLEHAVIVAPSLTPVQRLSISLYFIILFSDDGPHRDRASFGLLAVQH